MNGLNKFLFGAIALIFSTNLCAQNAEIQLVRRIESPVISETGPCTREILQKAADSYIEAQAAGDLSTFILLCPSRLAPMRECPILIFSRYIMGSSNISTL